VDKADQIQVNLNIKFTKNTQLAHYTQMNEVYEDMEDLEQTMNDISLQVRERKWQEERAQRNEKEMETASKGTGNLFGDWPQSGQGHSQSRPFHGF
jgi:hypothetical protein